MSMNTFNKISFVTIVIFFGCSESTNSSGGSFLNGTWKEEYQWHSASIYIYPADSNMTKRSILTFFGNSFTLKIVPPHRYVNPENKSIVTSFSDSMYIGTYRVIDSTITFYITNPFEDSMGFYCRIQNDTLFIRQASIYNGNYRIYPILWGAASNKFSGAFSIVH